jgi:two-component system, sensor histidine kinase LadS
VRRLHLNYSALLALLVLLSALSGTTFAAHAAPLLLTSGQGRIPLTGHLEFLKDGTGKLTFQDVTSPERSKEFTSIPGPLAAGYVHGGAVWLRFAIRRAATASPTWILGFEPATTEHIQLHIPLPDGGFEIRNGGALLPFSEREIPSRLDLYRLTLPPDQPQTILVRIASNRSVMSLPVFWEPDTLQ